MAIPQALDGPPDLATAASGTVITDNIFRNNQTDICDESDSTTIGDSNGAPTVSGECVVEPGIDF